MNCESQKHESLHTRKKNHLISVEKGKKLFSLVFLIKGKLKNPFSKRLASQITSSGYKQSPALFTRRSRDIRKTKRKFAIGNCFRAAFLRARTASYSASEIFNFHGSLLLNSSACDERGKGKHSSR